MGPTINMASLDIWLETTPSRSPRQLKSTTSKEEYGVKLFPSVHKYTGGKGELEARLIVMFMFKHEKFHGKVQY